MEGENISGQQAAAPGSAMPENASTPEQQSQEQKPLDEAAVRKIAEEIATRTAQSLVDKAEYRISRKAQEQIKALDLNKTVLGLDDQQVQQAKQKIIMDELTQPTQETPPSEPAPASYGQQEADPVAQFITDTFKAAGAEVTPADPEWQAFQKTMDEQFNNPSGAPIVAAAAVTASKAKQARLAANQSSAAARVTSGAAAPAGNSTLDPNAPAISFFKEAYKKK